MLWYKRLEKGEVATKKEIIQDFKVSMFFSLIFSFFTLICGIVSSIEPGFIGLTILSAAIWIVYTMQIHFIKLYYRDNYFKKELK